MSAYLTVQSFVLLLVITFSESKPAVDPGLIIDDEFFGSSIPLRTLPALPPPSLPLRTLPPLNMRHGSSSIEVKDEPFSVVSLSRDVRNPEAVPVTFLPQERVRRRRLEGGRRAHPTYEALLRTWQSRRRSAPVTFGSARRRPQSIRSRFNFPLRSIDA